MNGLVSSHTWLYFAYRLFPMSKQSDARKLLAENLTKLRKAGESELAFGKRVGVSQRTANRLLAAKNGTSLDTLTVIASKLGFEPWQLLVRGFDIKSKPVIAALTDDEEKLYRKLVNAQPSKEVI